MSQSLCNTIENCLKTARQQLIEASLTESPQLDAELLLSHVLQVSRTYLFTWPEKPLNTEQSVQFQRLISQRIEGQPIAYLVGEREFWGLKLQVTTDTLIPRPDTETLVDAVLALYAKNKTHQAWSILDLGTGTGAIALALKSEVPDFQITAVDFSENALAVARQNAKNHQLKITFLQSDWLSALDQEARFDCIVSNPPYIEESDPHLDQGDVRFEPTTALTSGSDGLDDIRKITHQAWSHLNPNGWLLIEHGYNQADAVASIFESSGFANIRLLTDLAGTPRVTLGQKLART